jgi:hypothetical protein
VAVLPPTATVPAGTTTPFSATVTGTPNHTVAWSATGGTIAPDGTYKAGSTPGTYTVTATSQADPSASDTATVTVTASGGVTVYSSGAYIDPEAAANGVGGAGCGPDYSEWPARDPVFTLSGGCTATWDYTDPDTALHTFADAGGSGTISFDETFAANGELVQATANGAFTGSGSGNTGYSGGANGDFSLTFDVARPTQMTLHIQVSDAAAFQGTYAIATCNPSNGGRLDIIFPAAQGTFDRTVQLPVGRCFVNVVVGANVGWTGYPGDQPFDDPTASFDADLAFAG